MNHASHLNGRNFREMKISRVLPQILNLNLNSHEKIEFSKFSKLNSSEKCNFLQFAKFNFREKICEIFMLDFNGKSTLFPLLSLLSFTLDYSGKLLYMGILYIFSPTRKIRILDQIENKILIFHQSCQSISIIFFLITFGWESDNKLLISYNEAGFFLSAFFLLFVGTFVFC